MGQIDTYNIPSTSIPSGSTINKVTLKYVAGSLYSSYLGKARGVIRTHSTLYYGTLHNPLPAVWTLYSDTWTNNPNTSSAWTISEINALQIGIDLTSFRWLRLYNYGAACTQVYVEIDYTPADVTATPNPTTIIGLVLTASFKLLLTPIFAIAKTIIAKFGFRLIKAKSIILSIINAIGFKMPPSTAIGKALGNIGITTAAIALAVVTTLAASLGLIMNALTVVIETLTTKIGFKKIISVIPTTIASIGFILTKITAVIKSIFGSYEQFVDVTPIATYEITDNPRGLVTIDRPKAILTIDRRGDTSTIGVERIRV